jgi:hypothetical protein
MMTFLTKKILRISFFKKNACTIPGCQLPWMWAGEYIKTVDYIIGLTTERQ